MSIRAIEKMYGVGQEKAKFIQSTYYERAFDGRPPAEISQEELDYVLNYRTNFNVGYQRLYKVAQRDPNFNPPQKFTEHHFRKIYDFKDLYMISKEYKEVKNHDLRFVARYANQAWHTDLHYLELLKEEEFQQRYLIGFVDDRSRKLLHFEIINDKEAKTTSYALRNALKKYPPPKTLIVDNGKEFIADFFIETLNEYGIEKHNVHLYTTQENGKVERFWYSIERARVRPLRSSYLISLV